MITFRKYLLASAAAFLVIGNHAFGQSLPSPSFNLVTANVLGVTGQTTSGTVAVTGTLTAANGSFAAATNHINLGLTTSAVTPYIDFFSTGSNTQGMRIISTGANNLVFQAGATTTVGSFNGTGFSTPNLTLNPPTVTWAGTAVPVLISNQVHTGSSVGTASLNRFVINDTVATSAHTNSFDILHQYGGGTTAGGRNALNVTLLQTAANADTGVDNFYVGATIQTFGRFSQPGATVSQPLGSFVGLNATASVQSGFTAQNAKGVNAAEFDVGISTGSTSLLRTVLNLADLQGAVQGYNVDNMIWMYGAGMPFRYGLMFGDQQPWPIDAAVGTMVGANIGGGGYASRPFQTKWGVDLQQVIFPATGNPYDGGVFRSKGITIDGNGTVQLGTTYLSPGASGLTIDAKGSVGSGTSIASAGSGYSTGGVSAEAVTALGGIWLVTTNGSGIPVSVATLVQPAISSTSPPANPIAPTKLNKASLGSGLTLNVTWNTTATTLSLNPSGGVTTVGGNLTGASLTSSGASGLGSITAGAGSTNHVVLSPAALGTSPTITGTGDSGLFITTASSLPIKVGAPLSITPATVLSGSSLTPLINIATNISGSLSGSGQLVNIFVNSDNAALSTPNTVTPFQVIEAFGGVGTNGGRRAAFFNLVSNVAIPSGGADQQYNTLISFYDGLVNVGGTSPTPGASRGSAVAFYPQTWLHPGATNYTSAVNFEADIIVTSTIQNLTVGGTIVAGDVISLVFTSASDIPGSPVTVTYTVGSGNTATHIVNGLMAAINANINLQTAGVAGMQDSVLSSILDINSQTQTTVSVAATSTGSETLALGSIVGGASTKARNGASIARGSNDSQQGFSVDTGFGLGSLPHAAISGGFKVGYWVAGNVIDRAGTIFGAIEQTILNEGSVQGPFAPLRVKYGFDLSNVNFTQANGASLRMPGFQVDGTGMLSLKNATFTTNTNGLSIDVVGKIGSGNPAIVSGGGGGSGVLQSNYFPGDIVKDANGGQYLVTTTNPSTGAATALTTLVQPSTSTASLGTAIATTGGSGAGLTITPTSIANIALSLMPTAGGKLGFNGATPIVKATPVGACAGNTGCQALRDALGNLGLINTGSITN